MPIPERTSYLAEATNIMRTHWPANRGVNIVCHGHSVPAGYFATPRVDTFNAYPHLLHAALKQRFPFAVINVIVTAIGGESSESGARRFAAEVLCHRADVVTIDYGLNDRGMGLEQARGHWENMIRAARTAGSRPVLLTPTWDSTQSADAPAMERQPLEQHAALIRALAAEHDVALADSFAAYQRYVDSGQDLTDLLSWSNHPNRRGHELVARELLRWFPAA
jgi:acyl-CoA thioesterase I